MNTNNVVIVRKLGFRNWLCFVAGVGCITNVHTAHKALEIGKSLVSGTV